MMKKKEQIIDWKHIRKTYEEILMILEGLDNVRIKK